MKQGEPTLESEPTTGDNSKEPTREEIIKWYGDQIEIAELRHKLTTLQSETVQAEALRMEALAVLHKFQQPEEKGEETNQQAPAEQE